MTQLDFLCLSCPLKTCDESSLWCMVRFIAKPNAAQKALMAERPAIKALLAGTAKQQYDRARYQANREVYLARANERNRAKRKEAMA